MDQLLFTEVCSEMAYLDFLGSGSLASLPPPCCLHSESHFFKLFLSSLLPKKVEQQNVS